MALISCSECDNQVSDKAAACPHCGAPVQPQLSDSAERASVSSQASSSKLMVLARAAAAAANYEQAYDYASRVLEGDPTNAAAWVVKGEAAGWQSSVIVTRIPEMLTCFNAAVVNISPAEAQPVKEHLTVIVNNVVVACHQLARQHMMEMIKLDENAWSDYLERCTIFLTALDVAHILDPSNRTTIENVIYICNDNIEGITFTPLLKFLPRKVQLSAEYEVQIRDRMKAYTAKLQ